MIERMRVTAVSEHEGEFQITCVAEGTEARDEKAVTSAKIVLRGTPPSVGTIVTLSVSYGSEVDALYAEMEAAEAELFDAEETLILSTAQGLQSAVIEFQGARVQPSAQGLEVRARAEMRVAQLRRHVDALRAKWDRLVPATAFRRSRVADAQNVGPTFEAPMWKRDPRCGESRERLDGDFDTRWPLKKGPENLGDDEA